MKQKPGEDKAAIQASMEAAEVKIVQKLIGQFAADMKRVGYDQTVVAMGKHGGRIFVQPDCKKDFLEDVALYSMQLVISEARSVREGGDGNAGKKGQRRI